MDPRSLYCLSGIAVRMAQRMGLTFDGTSYGLRPFQVEMRRRLWWQVLLLDLRVSELSGAGSSIRHHTWTTKLPSNVNDSDLFPDMKEPPQDHPGATEMVFVLHRCEVTLAMKQLADKSIPLSVVDAAIDDLEKRLEKSYIQYCDPSIPFHMVTILMVKLNSAKLRMMPRHPHLMANIIEVPTAERDFLFNLALQCLENHNKMMSLPSLERFMWHVLTNFPFPAHVYLLCSLRHRTMDELADRAWVLFEERFENQNMKFTQSEFWRKNKDSAIHLAIGNLVHKAWEARERAYIAANLPVPPTPDFLLRIRQQIAEKKGPKSISSSAGTETTPPNLTTTDIPNQFADSYQWFNPGPVDSNQNFDLMPGVMTADNQPIGWDFWNDLVQPSIPGYPYEGVPLEQAYSG